uniref:Protein kinase domain-containing protein n=1 Tax=Chromera velia CCMP2878 TaxID=1169474 RepID=A0A0G4FIQ4_9ALVE|eukprot:Cvel_17124.t1-p1 / transcript=Cvel_17124.t1 / gene=Cvel_17124 / organism=Chromera_velia_CCMP2878 / gene_product=hypothetical protein / transcript_product=hypothetical protein / location=Cvel_scaffold1351:18351-19289(-) / protein_length=313 / sequence_SO=supercontig / SO=protein_coding / is_pseudo=false
MISKSILLVPCFLVSFLLFPTGNGLSLSKRLGVLTTKKRTQKKETGSTTATSACEGLEGCHVLKQLGGGAQGDVFVAEAVIAGTSKKVVIKLDTKSKVDQEAESMQAVSNAPWGNNLTPVFHEKGVVSGSKDGRLVMELLGEETIGDCVSQWQTVGHLAGGGGDFTKSQDIDFAVAAKNWVSILRAIKALKEHKWHHCDTQPYNLFVNQCATTAKLIDWERAHAPVGGKEAPCRSSGDVLKLLTSFAFLFGKNHSNALMFTIQTSSSGRADGTLFPSDKRVQANVAILGKARELETADEELAFIGQLLEPWEG